MGDYYISPPGQTGWAMKLSFLAAKLRQTWPDVDVQELVDPQYIHAIDWTLSWSERVLRGSIFRTGQVVVLKGDVRDCADFALWFRSLVPAEYPLVFYDEGYSAQVELKWGMSREQVAAPFSQHLNN